MNERDELARTLWDHDMSTDTTPEWREMAWNDMSDGEDYERAEYEMRADAILAAGYRKPRTITTAEELDALADDSIILDAESVDWRRNGNLNFTPTWQTSLADDFAFKDAITLPATVLWEPK